MSSADFSQTRVAVVIPAYNEEAAIGKVITAIPRTVTDIIVANNNSSDATAEVARQAGAQVIDEPEQGYGAACLKAIEHLRAHHPPEILVFLDGDYSDYPEELPQLIAPIMVNEADLVIGSRVLGTAQKGALMPVQKFGNWLSTWLIRLIWRVRFTDLGPFRAIRWQAYERLNMADRNYGWTVEMQVKAAQQRLRCTEVPVSYRPRIGQSKVSGTIMGSVKAGVKILWVIAWSAWRRESVRQG